MTAQSRQGLPGFESRLRTNPSTNGNVPAVTGTPHNKKGASEVAQAMILPAPVLTSVRAREVRPGDRLEVFGAARVVLSVVRGNNRQVYLCTKTDAGAPVVSEHDPGERVSVWRVSA